MEFSGSSSRDEFTGMSNDRSVSSHNADSSENEREEEESSFFRRGKREMFFSRERFYKESRVTFSRELPSANKLNSSDVARYSRSRGISFHRNNISLKLSLRIKGSSEWFINLVKNKWIFSFSFSVFPSHVVRIQARNSRGDKRDSYDLDFLVLNPTTKGRVRVATDIEIVYRNGGC